MRKECVKNDTFYIVQYKSCPNRFATGPGKHASSFFSTNPSPQNEKNTHNRYKTAIHPIFTGSEP